MKGCEGCEGLLGGSWVLKREQKKTPLNQATTIVAPFLTLLTSTHEPPSSWKEWGLRLKMDVFGASKFVDLRLQAFRLGLLACLGFRV